MRQPQNFYEDQSSQVEQMILKQKSRSGIQNNIKVENMNQDEEGDITYITDEVKATISNTASVQNQGEASRQKSFNVNSKKSTERSLSDVLAKNDDEMSKSGHDASKS